LFERRKSGTYLAVVVVLLVSVLAACSSSKSSTASSTTSPSGASSPSGAAPSSGQSYPAIPPGPIVFSIADDESGSFAQDGLAENKRIQAGLAIFNQENPNGIDGHPIELKIVDSGSNPTTAVNAARQLIADKVTAVFGTSFDPPSTAQQTEILNNAKVIQLGQLSTDEFLNPAKYPYVFTVEASPETEGQVSGNWIVGHSLTKVAVLTDDSPADQEIIPNLQASLGSKATIVKQVTVPIGATDVSAAIQELKSAGPDVVEVLISDGLGTVWNAMNTIGWTPKVVTTEGVYFDGYSALGAVGSSVYNLCPAALDLNENPPANVASAVASITQQIGALPDRLAPIQVFVDQFEIMKYAIDKYNSLDPVALKSAIESIHNQSFFYNKFVFDFSPDNHAGYVGLNVCPSKALNSMGIPIISPTTGSL
jgi:branched-chain amino acid transport system substrate-binding protein